MSRRNSFEMKDFLVFIQNIDQSLSEEIEQLCESFDPSVRLQFKTNREQQFFCKVYFSSESIARKFLDERPHSIKDRLINVSIYSESINTKNILFVNVAKNPPFNENDLFEYSRKTFGRVLNCTLYADRFYGFVHFDREYDALKAISATNCQINGRSFRYLSRSAPSKASASPGVSTTKTVHIGNFRRLDEAKVLQMIGPIQTKLSYTDSSGQNYVSISLDDQSRSHLLNRRPICLNGRVLNVFSDHEEQHKNELSVLIRYVPQRLNDFNLLEYFSQFGRVLNCFRLEKSDSYSVRFENSADLASDLSAIGVHRIKGAPVKVETNLQT